MALGRRLLRVLLAAAVAFAPLGSAATAAHAKSEPATATHQTQLEHAHHHADMGSMQAIVPEAARASMPCHGDKMGERSGHGCCRDGKSNCDSSCLQKCFGQAAVVPSMRGYAFRVAQTYHLLPGEPAPDWRAAPHPPPPRA